MPYSHFIRLLGFVEVQGIDAPTPPIPLEIYRGRFNPNHDGIDFYRDETRDGKMYNLGGEMPEELLALGRKAERADIVAFLKRMREAEKSVSWETPNGKALQSYVIAEYDSIIKYLEEKDTHE